MDSTTYLNRYQLSLDEKGVPIALHRGPSGVTYRAENIETDQAVAVKLMPTYAFEATELHELEAEARAAQEVEHPNIARLYDFGFSGTDVVFVTEVLDGTTLDAWVAEHGPLPAAPVLRIALQVVSGLAAAAFQSVVHRALQPANLMIVPGQTPDGEWPFVKVLNFGGVPPTLSNSAVSFGQGGPSPQFAAPEQLEGKPANFRSELYSLGCTMWFLLTGVPPTPGAVDKGGAVPKPLRPLLAQLVALDPMQRPQDPVALQQQLNDCLATVERRSPIAAKFGAAPAIAPAVVTSIPVGDAPDLTPVEEAPTRALLKPLALAAAVLLLVGIVALAVPPLLRWRQAAAAEPIGVPVGVPERSAAALARTETSAVPAPSATAEQNVATATTETPATDAVSSPAVAVASPLPEAGAAESPAVGNDQALVSVLPPAPGAAESSPAEQPVASSNSNVATEPARVAANEPAPSAAPEDIPNSGGGLPAGERKSSNKVAQNSEESDRDVSSAPAASASRRTEEPTPARDRVANVTELKIVPTPEPTATPVRKRSSRVVRSEVRPAEPVQDSELVNAPPPPSGTKRARYLGTTPQGDLIFGLPSNERGYADPPPAAPDTRRARRARPVIAPSAAPTEEARPAQPVESDGR